MIFVTDWLDGWGGGGSVDDAMPSLLQLTATSFRVRRTSARVLHDTLTAPKVTAFVKCCVGSSSSTRVAQKVPVLVLAEVPRKLTSPAQGRRCRTHWRPGVASVGGAEVGPSA